MLPADWNSSLAARIARLGNDGRYAVRRLARTGRSTLITIAILALGIGFATATFSIVDATLLRPVPWPAPEELFRVYTVPTDAPQAVGNARRGVRWAEWRAIGDANVFPAAALWSEPLPFLIQGQPDFARALTVSSTFLDVLGTKVARGRMFTAAEDRDTNDSVVLSHEAWQRRFGGRPDIIGQRIGTQSMWRLVGTLRTRVVVGVLPPDFGALEFFFEGRALTHPRGFLPRVPPEILLPLENSRAIAGSALYSAIARLPRGASPGQVASMATVALGTVVPASVTLHPFIANQTRTYARSMLLLFGGASVLLLVTASSVAGLLMAQARARHHEVAVREALGATRWDIARELAIEHGLLALGAAVAGSLASLWISGLLVSLIGPSVPGLEVAGPSVRVFLFAGGAAAVVALVIGTAPAWSMRRRVAEGLAFGGRTTTGRHGRTHRLIVAAEIAITVVLVASAGLFAETMGRLANKPLGFDPKGLAVVATRFVGEAGAGPRVVEQTIANLRGVPGVTDIAMGTAAPFMGAAGSTPLSRVDARSLLTEIAVVSPNYFEILRIRPVAGTTLARRPDLGPTAAVVSQSVEMALGPRLVSETLKGSGSAFEIVGVVPDVFEYHALDAPPKRLYTTVGDVSGQVHFLVRTHTDPDRMLPALLRAAASSLDLVVLESSSMETVVARSLAVQRLRAWLAAFFASTAVLLAVVGIYAMTTISVAERRREIALRLAIGAQPSDIKRMVLRDGVVTALYGIGLGLPVAGLLCVAFLRSLVGVPVSLPLILAVSAAVPLLTSVLAGWPPARRSSLVDPAAVLTR